MLQYLVILLDDTSVSYCHYTNRRTHKRLIDIDILKKSILFAMKENLQIQFVYPDYELPETYKEVIETIDHSKIVSANYTEIAEVIVLDDWNQIPNISYRKNTTYILQTCKSDFFNRFEELETLLKEVTYLSVVLTDIETFKDSDFDLYKSTLNHISNIITNLYERKIFAQLNLLTDRITLGQMNNCNAGDENITLAPNGKFYICPAFYFDNEMDSIGNLKEGLNIKNPQLYKLDYAPICRKCDAYQCKRCIYLNRKTTLEVNIPSHEQCVTAHLERNSSRELLDKIRKNNDFLSNRQIKKILYLDPFEHIKR